MKTNLKTSTVAGINLAANALAVIAASVSLPSAVAAPSALKQPQDSATAEANSISMASIEKSFLEVPRVC